MLSTRLLAGFRKLYIFDSSRLELSIRNISTTTATCREVDDRREMLRSLPAPDEGTAGERAVDIDARIQ